MGPAGTFTPVHRDVCAYLSLEEAFSDTSIDCSYSWSTNIAGRKRWWLFPPEVTPCLRRFPDQRTSELVRDVRDVDETRIPRLREAWEGMLVIDQEPGETLFVYDLAV